MYKYVPSHPVLRATGDHMQVPVPGMEAFYLLNLIFRPMHILNIVTSIIFGLQLSHQSHQKHEHDKLNAIYVTH